MRPKIKSLFISHSSAFYGAEQSFLFLLQHLNKELFEPIVVLPKRLSKDKEFLLEKINSLNIKIIIINSPLWINAKDNATLLQSLLEEFHSAKEYVEIIKKDHIDIIYTNTITKISGAIAAKLYGIPHIWHIREILKDHPLKSPFSFDTTFKLVDQLSDRIITNSRSVAQQFSAVSQNKVEVVYNAIDTNTFAKAESDNRLHNELSIAFDCPLIGIIGTIHKHKNHEDAVKAFGYLKQRGFDAILVIVGQDDGEYKNVLVDLAKALDLEDRVAFLGFRHDIPEIVKELDIVLVPSLAEPFGRTTIEAMAAGKPVVSTNTGASPEIVVDGVTGYLVPPRNPEKMAEAIMKILSDPKMAKKMGLAGRDRVIRTFTRQNYISGVENIFIDTYTSFKKGAMKKNPLQYKDVISDALDIIELIELRDIIRYIVYKNEHSKKLFSFDQKNTITSEVYIEEKIGFKERNEQIEEIYNSLSWRITKPLRWALDRLLKLRLYRYFYNWFNKKI